MTPWIKLHGGVVARLGGARRMVDAAILCRSATLAAHCASADGWFPHALTTWADETGCALDAVRQALRRLVSEEMLEVRQADGRTSEWRLGARAGEALGLPDPSGRPTPRAARPSPLGPPDPSPLGLPDPSGRPTTSPRRRPYAVGDVPLGPPDPSGRPTLRENTETERERGERARPLALPLDELDEDARRWGRAWIRAFGIVRNHGRTEDDPNRAEGDHSIEWRFGPRLVGFARRYGSEAFTRVLQRHVEAPDWRGFHVDDPTRPNGWLEGDLQRAKAPKARTYSERNVASAPNTPTPQQRSDAADARQQLVLEVAAQHDDIDETPWGTP